MTKDEQSARIQELVSNPDFIRNLGIVSHIHHGKTTLTDKLAASAGLMSDQLVGERMLTWIDDQEKERLMTIYGATVTMAHRYGERQQVMLFPQRNEDYVAQKDYVTQPGKRRLTGRGMLGLNLHARVTQYLFHQICVPNSSNIET